MSAVTIVKAAGRIKRVKRGVTPVLDLDLNDNQRVVSVDFHEAFFGPPERTTVDWNWTAYIETSTTERGTT